MTQHVGGQAQLLDRGMGGDVAEPPGVVQLAHERVGIIEVVQPGEQHVIRPERVGEPRQVEHGHVAVLVLAVGRRVEHGRLPGRDPERRAHARHVRRRVAFASTSLRG